MPASVYIHLASDQTFRLQPYTNTALGWLLSVLYQVDPDLSEALHQPSVLQPYSLSTWVTVSDEAIMAEHQGRGDQLKPAAYIVPGERISLRVAAADEDLLFTILDALDTAELPPLCGCHVDLADPVDDVDFAGETIFSCPWDALLAAPPAQGVRLSFVSPTLFSSQGTTILLPELHRLFESWQRKWDAWKGPDIPLDSLQAVLPHIVVDGYSLATSVHPSGKATHRGFQGDLDLWFGKGLLPAERQALTALAGFANFCGTGAKGSFGFGQTRAQSR